MPSGGTKPEVSHDFTPNTFAQSSEANRNFDDLVGHLTTDAPLGWHRLVDDEKNSIDLDFVSASAPTYKVETSSAVNITNIVSKGMKIRVEQNTGGTKYGWIITDPTVNTNSKTEFEILTTSTIQSAPIKSPCFSAVESPHGFAEPPVGGVYGLSSSQTIPSGSSEQVKLDTVRTTDDYDLLDDTNHEILIPRDGLYSVKAQCALELSGTSVRHIFRFFVNGSNSTYGNSWEQSSDAGRTNQGPAIQDRFSKGDKITLQVYHESGEDRSLRAGANDRVTLVFLWQVGS